MSEPGLSGKTVLVTGAAKRIGRGIALRLSAEGARVAIHYHHSEKEARATAGECGGAELFRANLESVPEIVRMFGEVEQRLGRLDGLVNNAARFTRFDPLDMTEKDWDFIHAVNLKAVFFCCQRSSPWTTAWKNSCAESPERLVGLPRRLSLGCPGHLT